MKRSLNATVEPEDATDKTVEWSTSDESVATVADGLVTLVADGNATITAKCGEFTVTCSVIVDSTNVGIEAIEAGDDVKARYFNLQGIEVINPAEGRMVIERKGTKCVRWFSDLSVIWLPVLMPIFEISQ